MLTGNMGDFASDEMLCNHACSELADLCLSELSVQSLLALGLQLSQLPQSSCEVLAMLWPVLTLAQRQAEALP